MADARKRFGHKTRSTELIETLPAPRQARFREVMEADYALFDRARRAEFAT